MKKRYMVFGRRRIVVISTFSGMDLFMLGGTRAGMTPGYAVEWNFNACLMHRGKFKHPDGTPVMEPFVNIPPEEYKLLRENEQTKDTVGIIDGQHVRTKSIQEVNGYDIRAAVEARYGTDVIIVLIGGPPCQDFTKINRNKNTGELNRNPLVLEYVRILKQLSPDAALMEEVTDFKSPQHNGIYDEFIVEVTKLPYKIAMQEMNSLHYGGNQSRWRLVIMFVHEKWDTQPVFPVAHPEKAKRVKDFLPHVDHFISGHFTDTWKNKNHFMCTVTSGSPTTFEKAGKLWSPTVDELLLCMDVQKDEYLIPEGISQQQIRKAIGNGVCVSVAEALATTLIKEVFRLKPDGDGYWVSIDAEPDGPDNSPDDVSPVPVIPGGDVVAPDEVGPATTDDVVGIATGVVNPVAPDGPAPTDAPVVVSPDTTLPADSDTVSQVEIPPADGNVAVVADNTIPTNEINLVQDNNTAETKLVAINQDIATTESAPTAPAVIFGPTVPALAVIKPIKYHESGFVLWQGKSLLNGENIIAIITLQSENRKTGNMAQLWILAADLNPLDAIKTGKDEAVCGSCILRQGMEGACYVEVGKGPNSVYKALKNGAYPKLPIQYYNQLSGLSVRLGAYGDPAAIPVHILEEIKKYAKNYTGYTHQWKNAAFSELKSLCMASVDNIEEQLLAAQMGWRTFRIIKKKDALLTGEILCPNITSDVQCKECRLCSGTALKAKNIAVHVHGNKENKFNPLQAAAPATVEVTPTAPAPVKDTSPADNDFKKIDPPKIISSNQLQHMQFQSLNFEGQWNELFGLPSVNFHCIVHGKSGHGKSTFAIQFAKYLADNFGSVLYISGEEGFNKTFKDKFANNDAVSESLHVANFRSYDHIIQEAKCNSYKFIFIDSLDTMKIDACKLRKLRAKFKSSALITISQATKSGQMRGSYEIVHDSDIAVEVTDGIAKTTKNRFKATGMVFNVFQQMNGDDAAPVDPHTGKRKITPHKVFKPVTIEEKLAALNTRLEDAVAEENYEMAAKLRDEINNLKNKNLPS